jgi:two-component system OmpR family sensor kinase
VHVFRSLTARLVLTAVALVVLVAVLIGAAATAALHSRLTAQVDDQLNHAFQARRPDGLPGGGPDPDDAGSTGGSFFDPRNLRQGAVLARLDPADESQSVGSLTGDDPGSTTALTPAQLTQLKGVPVDAKIHSLHVSGLGGFRVISFHATDGYTYVAGLPTNDVDAATRSLLQWEALLIGLGAVVAAGGGMLLVRRQLRPLSEVAATAHEVAALPLASGEVDLSPRVPPELTDERTEVGQVGAALNTLLAHMESSLEARQRSEQQVRQFVADASHELRTPLSTITGYAELARRRPEDSATTATALSKVEEESARMTSLVEDMLLLARLDAGRPLEQVPVDLSRLLVEAVDDARVVGPDHKWRLELAADGEPVEVTGDEQRLHQVVTNLLTNARKHTPAGTTVTVTCRTDGFDVHDDGPGFPADFVDKAFERFARVDQARQRTGGAGLGLSLVEAIVRSHGGTVTLTSAPGGTTVAVRLR